MFYAMWFYAFCFLQFYVGIMLRIKFCTQIVSCDVFNMCSTSSCVFAYQRVVCECIYVFVCECVLVYIYIYCVCVCVWMCIKAYCSKEDM